MGSSYRTDLNRGDMHNWEADLREAIRIIEHVADQVSDCLGDDGQSDNAADDGALCNLLWQAIKIIKAELPLLPEERAERIKRLERELAALKG